MTSLDKAKDKSNDEPGNYGESTIEPKDELIALAESQAERFISSLIEQKKLLAESEMCDTLEITLQELEKEDQQNRIFYLSQDRCRYYPAFYVDGRIFRITLESVTQALENLDGPKKWQFLTRPKGSLAGKTSLEALQESLLDKVLIAAKVSIERWERSRW